MKLSTFTLINEPPTTKLEAKSKETTLGPPRFLIRIPRSAAASPIASIHNEMDKSLTGIVNQTITQDNTTSSTNPSERSNPTTNQTVATAATSNWCAATPVAHHDHPIGTNWSRDTTTKYQHPLEQVMAITSNSTTENDSLPDHNPKKAKQSTDPASTPDHLPKQESELVPPIAIEFELISQVSQVTKDEKNLKRVNEPQYLGCFDYEAFRPPRFGIRSKPGSTFDIKIPQSLLLQSRNSTISKRCLWGGKDGIYTDDSDIPAILKHQGWEIPPVPLLRVHVKILSPLVKYPGIDQNGLRSRSWGAGHRGYSIRVIGVKEARPAARHKTPPLISDQRDGRLVCFSNLSKRPMLSFCELLFDPLMVRQRLLTGSETESKTLSTGLHLVGRHCEYRLQMLPKSSSFVIIKEDSVLFDKVGWEEIGWVAGGLVIRNTFLNLMGYYW